MYIYVARSIEFIHACNFDVLHPVNEEKYTIWTVDAGDAVLSSFIVALHYCELLKGILKNVEPEGLRL